MWAPLCLELCTYHTGIHTSFTPSRRSLSDRLRTWNCRLNSSTVFGGCLDVQSSALLLLPCSGWPQEPLLYHPT